MASALLDTEAVESEGEDEDMTEGSRSRKLKSRKRKRAMVSSDEEEEEVDEAKIAEEMKGFVVEEGEEDEEAGEDKDDKESSSDESDDDLAEEDLDLVEENVGIKVARNKYKRMRVRLPESEDEDEAGAAEAPKDQLASELFGNGGDEEIDSLRGRAGAVESIRDRDEEASDAGSDEGDFADDDGFIVDDVEGPRPGVRRAPVGTRPAQISDSALEEARGIFGVDFDYDEFLGEYGDEEEEEAEDEEMEVEDVGEGEEEVRPKRVPKQKKKATKKSLLEQIEPSEIERGFLGEFDKKVQLEDKPERFQLRGVPVTEPEEGEMDEESKWIYHFAFCEQPISLQEDMEAKQEQTIESVLHALNLIRVQHFEVPFIAFYRKEYVDPYLNITDLWKVYHWDEKWCQMRKRKRNLLELFERMQKFQFDMMMQNPDQPLSDDIRTLDEDDIERVRQADSADKPPEHLQDVYAHFLLYYGRDLTRLNNWERAKQATEGAEVAADPFKQASRRDAYAICLQAGLSGLAKMFGLTPAQFAENMSMGYAVNKPEQCAEEPLEAARNFVSSQFSTPEEVLKAVKLMVALQLSREPLVRQTVRKEFIESAKISVRPTKKGRKEIDENHPVYTKKYLKEKNLKNLEKDEFLKLVQAENHDLIKITMSMNSSAETSYLERLIAQQLYHRDEYSDVAQSWNKLREEVLEQCLEHFLFPQFVKELRMKLLAEARECVIKECCLRLYNWLKIGPYLVEGEEELTNGVKVLSIAYSDERDQAAFAVLLDQKGELVDFIKLLNVTKRKDSPRQDERRMKEQDLNMIKQFVTARKPNVICVATESRSAMILKEELEAMVAELEEDGTLPKKISVELVDNELAKIYQTSKRAEQDFREYPLILRQAVSLGRRLQDPLIEFCQACTPDEEILCINYHPLQSELPKDDLLNALLLEFINRVNEVGVDINRCLEHPHTAPTLQFVCGLGPRKAAYLLKILRQNDNRLESRTRLVTLCHMGPKVFMNCAGFIRIEPGDWVDKTNTYVELLDGSRVHPETYEWARKMAVDALEYDDSEQASEANALEEILETPEKLKDLDLDAFAEELERQGFGNRGITLYDIRAELNHRYKDLRAKYRPPSKEEVFNLLTKETPQTFNVGKLVLARVIGIGRKKPAHDQAEQTNPVRNDLTNLWQCPFCMRSDFAELSQVWTHFDSKQCPGQATGVRVRLENGLLGFIPTKYLSDKRVDNPEDRVQQGMSIYCRVLKVDIDRFTCELSSRSSDLLDRESQFRPTKDLYYDFKMEDLDRQQEENQKQSQERRGYVKRVITHPLFHNVSYKEAEQRLATMDQGEVVIRPSSKGSDHLTFTWKVANEVYQHIDVRETEKENAFSLGRRLYIGDEEFEDLDEIVASHVGPMASYARDILNFKYYMDAQGGDKQMLEAELMKQKERQPTRIPYFLSASKEFPGKFLLSYLPRTKSRHEHVTVTSNGFRYRGQIFNSLNTLFTWFKEHFRDPVPGTQQGLTPAPGTPLMEGSTRGSRHGGSVHSRTPGFDVAQAATGRTPGQWPQATPVFNTTPYQVFPPRASLTTPQYATPALNVVATPRPQFAPPQTPMSQFGAAMTPRFAPATPGQHPAAAMWMSAHQAPEQSSSGGGGFGGDQHGGFGNARGGFGQATASSMSGGGGDDEFVAPRLPGSRGRGRGGRGGFGDAGGSRGGFSGGNCYKCNKSGHMARDCPEDGADTGGNSGRSFRGREHGSSNFGGRSRGGGYSRGGFSSQGSDDSSSDNRGGFSRGGFGSSDDNTSGRSGFSKGGFSGGGSSATEDSQSRGGFSRGGFGSSTEASSGGRGGFGAADDSSDQDRGGFGGGRGRGRGRGGGGGGGGGITCYKCQKTGHIARECPEEGDDSGGGRGRGRGGFGGRGGGGGGMTCYRCNQPGHMSRECPEASKDSGGGGYRGRGDRSGSGRGGGGFSRGGFSSRGNDDSSSEERGGFSRGGFGNSRSNEESSDDRGSHSRGGFGSSRSQNDDSGDRGGFSKGGFSSSGDERSHSSSSRGGFGGGNVESTDAGNDDNSGWTQSAPDRGGFEASANAESDTSAQPAPAGSGSPVWE